MFSNLPVLTAKLMAASTTGQEMTTTDMIIQLLPFVLIIFIFYFILIRPQRKA